MSDNAMIWIVLAVAIGGCAASSISEDYRDTRKLEIESKERMTIYEKTGNIPAEKP